MTTKKKDKGTAVATAAPNAVTVPEEYQAFAGQGWDNVTAADIAIPFLNLLQDGSPQVKKSSSEKIEGAEAGFFIDSVSNELYGDDGVVIVPVLTEPKLVEWIPKDEGGGGGGLVGTYEYNGDVHKARLAAAGGDRTKMKSETDNDLVETFYMYALILESEDAIEFAGSGVMIPFSKSKIKPYRIGMGRVNKVKGSAQLPLFCNRLRLTAVPDTGKGGDDFFNVKLAPIVTDKGTDTDNVIASRIPGTLDGQPHPLLVVAQKFYEGLIGGTVKVDYTQGSEDSAKKGDGGEVKDGHF